MDKSKTNKPNINANNGSTNSNDDASNDDVKNVLKIDTTGFTGKLLDILNGMLINHFYTTAFLLAICSIVYMSIVYDADFSFLTDISNIVIKQHNFYSLIIVLIMIIFGMLFYIINKINSISIKNDIQSQNDVSFRKVIIDQFTAIRQDMNKYLISIDEFKNNYNNTHGAVVSVSKLLSDNVINTKKILSLLFKINNQFKNIPDKDTILQFLTFRSKLLMIDVIRVIDEHFRNLTPKEINQFNLYTVTDKSKNSFFEAMFINKINTVKNEYIVEIYQLSRDTLDVNIKDTIYDTLSKFFDKIVEYIVNDEVGMQLDEIIYYSIDNIKILVAELNTIYENNLLLTSFFDDNNINNNSISIKKNSIESEANK